MLLKHRQQRQTIISAAAHQVDTIVIGAGVIGLAIARAIVHHSSHQQQQREVLLIDRARQIGTETSSRNSEVIHAGIYYPYNSLKRRFCVEGKLLLYDYCTRDHRVPIQSCGKLIVANSTAQAAILQTLYQQAIANGVTDVQILSSEQVHADYESDIVATHGALLSPSTGIIDSHALMEQFRWDIEHPPDTTGTTTSTIALRTNVTNGYIDTTTNRNDHPYHIYVCTEDTIDGARSDCINPKDDTTTITPNSSSNDVGSTNTTQQQPLWLSCRRLINCSGLWSSQVAHYFHQDLMVPTTNSREYQWTVPTQYYCRGTYYKVQPSTTSSPHQQQQPKFRHLIYPVPDPSGNGLGIHATMDMSTTPQPHIKFGPDIEWIPLHTTTTTTTNNNNNNNNNNTIIHHHQQDPDQISLQPNSERAQLFYDSIRTYWPALQDNTLVPDYTGIRPKLNHPSIVGCSGSTFQDFMIVGPKTHGIPGLVHLFGMESPGLTSAMAIANYIVDLLEQ